MSPLAHVMIWGVKAYRLTLSAFIGNACRFQPSCSAYALEAIQRHGGLRGGRMALWRILRCNPWGGSGYDPVPGGPNSCGPDCCGGPGGGAEGGRRED